MIQQFIRKLFDTSDRDVRSIMPLVDVVNSMEADVEPLSLEQLRARIDDFRKQLAEGAPLESVLPEVFAVVREVGRRTIGMRLFDVQIVGAVVLHQGRIGEMRTGEGKTLVAVPALVLNALTGRGAHLVTVNDYLARRDAVWMGPIYHTLGLSVGVIQGQSPDSDELGGSYIYEPGFQHDDPRYVNLRPCSRRQAYECDITYGTNHEFGFDYLRDNMAFSVEHLSMRELHFAIIDEVDSILIDEARTPHIISGPSTVDVSVYRTVNDVVKQLTGGTMAQADEPGIHYVGDKKNHSASLTEEGMDLVEEMLGLENIANQPKMFHHLNAAVKAHAIFKKDVDYAVRNNEVVIVDENTGRMMFGRRYSDGLHQALEAKEGVPVQRESQTIATITFQNLFRMYHKLAGMTGTAKTEEDEFRKIYGLDVVAVPTHRDMIRTDHEDVVYKSLDAKYRGIARELLRLWTKQQPVLVGTRSIEMSEVVSARLTPEMLQKLLLTDMLFAKLEDKKVKVDKKDSDSVFANDLTQVAMKTIAAVNQSAGLPTKPLDDEVLTWFLDYHKLPSENRRNLEEALKHGIPHNVLNAKYHEKEAAIISEAGRKGAITIATNMAGRGVDILLGGRVADEQVKQVRAAEEQDGGVSSEFADTFKSFRRGGKERAAPPLPLDDQERFTLAEEVRAVGGLYILGTERHESRRIDNQLRGRSGRQGDPGESRFFVSLEDQLWRIFNAKMLENRMLVAWPPMEEVRNRMITGMIRKTQERIENHFFEARKHVLEYDDVLNSQREHIYSWRREILLGRDSRDDLLNGVDGVIRDVLKANLELDDDARQVFNYAQSYEQFNEIFPMVDFLTLDEYQAIEHGDPLEEKLTEVAREAYQRHAEEIGLEVMPQLEQQVMLRAINDKWMEHLQMIDYLREGISLRAYGQVDPLVAYKRETFDLFQNTLREIRDYSVRMIFRAQIQREQVPAPQMARLDESQAAEMDRPAPAAPAKPADLSKVDWKRVGRNDPCPCGSGKKFKSCHYAQLRNDGVI